MMFLKKLTGLFLFIFILNSCNDGKNKPDIDDIKLELKLSRFDKDFFSVDTLNIPASLSNLQKKYPDFTREFIENILGLSSDSVMAGSLQHVYALKLFLKDYRPLKDSTDKILGDFSSLEKELETASRYVKYYFPKYKLPQNIYTFVGPIDAMFETSFGFHGDVKTPGSYGIALQFHLGENFSFYKSLQGQAQFPEYILRRLDPKTIPVNAMKNVVDDLFQDRSPGKPLIEQMVEKGKRLYLLDRFLPDVAEYLKIGYSEKQLEMCYENEAVIWDMFLNNDLLNNSEQNIIKNYIGDSPKTQELGEDSPGNIGSFCGWQIVKNYMDKFPDTKLESLMNMDAREVYSKSKYRPR